MMTIEALAMNQADHLEALSIAVRVDGMKAENAVRQHRQEYPAYDESSFTWAADDMKKLVDRMRARIESGQGKEAKP
jgi:hypothetical protein